MAPLDLARRARAYLAASWRYVRTRSVRQVATKLLETYVFAVQEWAILRSDLAHPPPPAAADGLVIRPAGPGDDALLAGFEPWHPARELRAHLDDGCWLDLALDGDRPVAFRVVSPTGPQRAPLARMVTLRPGQVWVRDLFCRPEYRSRGVGRRLSVAMDRRLAALGHREILMANRLDNAPTLRLSLAKGNQLVFWFAYRRVLWFVRYRRSTDVARFIEAARGSG